MRFFMITAVLASAAFVLALPGGSGGAPKPHCPAGLYSNLQCCTTDVLNVADLDCSPYPEHGTCADSGAKAMCCVLPVATLGVLCIPALT